MYPDGNGKNQGKKHNIKHNSIVQDDDYILYTFFFLI